LLWRSHDPLNRFQNFFLILFRNVTECKYVHYDHRPRSIFDHQKSLCKFIFELLIFPSFHSRTSGMPRHWERYIYQINNLTLEDVLSSIETPLNHNFEILISNISEHAISQKDVWSFQLLDNWSPSVLNSSGIYPWHPHYIFQRSDPLLTRYHWSYNRHLSSLHYIPKITLKLSKDDKYRSYWTITYLHEYRSKWIQIKLNSSQIVPIEVLPNSKVVLNIIREIESIIYIEIVVK